MVVIVKQQTLFGIRTKDDFLRYDVHVLGLHCLLNLYDVYLVWMSCGTVLYSTVE